MTIPDGCDDLRVEHGHAIRALIRFMSGLDPIRDGRVIQIAVEVPTGGGGARVDRYEVQLDGSLEKWHYCRPPHERETSISSPAVWTCPECLTRWVLQVRTYYTTETADRDDAGNYDY